MEEKGFDEQIKVVFFFTTTNEISSKLYFDYKLFIGRNLWIPFTYIFIAEDKTDAHILKSSSHLKKIAKLHLG